MKASLTSISPAHLLLPSTLHLPHHHIRFSHLAQEDALKSRSNDGPRDEVYYTRSRIDLCASSLITIVITALLIVPIYLLYSLVKDQQGKLDSHVAAVCIAVLLVCTLLFSGVLSLFTRAKRHEILGAAAAYVCLVVSCTTSRCGAKFADEA